ncbi:hypothetical protein MTR67_037101 [Solanum verrucosum]|uniref:Uncharacterized protein n=1 Tax=Solanum verrucosum TaxID=315347 RepID=A0AAF0UDM6_SOLVR|nr:hypothetical protein MTR67_037101 [Solanum verrucosum]
MRKDCPSSRKCFTHGLGISGFIFWKYKI